MKSTTPFLLFLFFMLPVGSMPAPNWVLVLFVIVFLFLSLAFWRHSVVITSEYIQAGFPVYHVRIPWEDICSVEKVENIPAYAGCGIRLLKHNGSFIRAFNIPRMEKLLLDVKSRKDSSLLISVKNSERIISYIREKGEISRKNCK